MRCFDQVLLLAQGRVAYYGPSINGGLLSYFETAGYPFPLYSNPSDTMLDLVNADHGQLEEGAAAVDSSSVEGDMEAAAGGGTPDAGATSTPPAASRRQGVIDDLAARYATSQLAEWARAEPSAYPPPPVPSYGDGGRRFPTSWATQAFVVCERAFWYKWRNPDAVVSQFVGSVLMAVIVGSVFLQLPLTASGLRDRLSAIAFILMTQAFVAFDQLILMPMERAIMLRESSAGMYSTSAFFWGRTFAEWPLLSLLSLITAGITYGMFGLKADNASAGMYLLVVVLVTNVGASLLTLIGALSSSMAMGNGLGTLILVFASLFNGFFLSPQNMHVVYKWIFDLSFTSWGVQAAVFNELHGLEVVCSEAEVAAGCTGSGDALLETLGFAGTDPWRLCGLLLVQAVIWRVLAMFALHFMYTGQTFRERLRLLF